MKTTVIVPTLNRLELLKDAITTFREHHEGEDYEILVVDNGNDGSDAWCRDNGVEVLKPEHPLTFGQSNNLAAQQSKADYLLLLNNDTRATCNILKPMIETMAWNPKCVMVGAKLLHEDGRIQHAGVEFSREGIPHHVLYRSLKDLPCWQFDRPVNAVTAACALVKRSAWVKVHGFDTRYQSNYEDVDLCLKFRERGWDIWFSHKAEMIHLENQTRGEAGDIRPMLKVFMHKWVDNGNLHYLSRQGKLTLNFEARRLNVGCGNMPWPGYINIDQNDGYGVDIVRDCRKGLPFDNGSVERVDACDFVEHLTPEEAIEFMNEVIRVLKTGGVVRMLVPRYDRNTAFDDPTHKSFWTQNKIRYWLWGDRLHHDHAAAYGIHNGLRLVAARMSETHYEFTLERFYPSMLPRPEDLTLSPLAFEQVEEL